MKDEKEWTPLRYAVEHNSSLATAELLNADYTIGYQLIMKEDGMSTSAIHIAAGHGYCETMEVLIYKCLGCSEFIDDKGRNILHIAVENMKTKVIEFIFQDESLTNLINQKDSDGNTPIHLLVTSDFELMARLMDSRVDINILNNQHYTPLDKTSSKEDKERLLKVHFFLLTSHYLLIRMSKFSTILSKSSPTQYIIKTMYVRLLLKHIRFSN